MQLYKGSINGMRIVGYAGGTNGNFFNIDVKDPKTGNLFRIDVDSLGRLYLRYSNIISRQSRITKEFDAKGMIVQGGRDIGDGYFRSIVFIDPKSNKKYIAQEWYGIIKLSPEGYEIYSEPSPKLNEPDKWNTDRKKKSAKAKPKRTVKKVIKRKRCTCK